MAASFADHGLNYSSQEREAVETWLRWNRNSESWAKRCAKRSAGGKFAGRTTRPPWGARCGSPESMVRPWAERLLRVPAGETPRDVENLLGEAVARAVKYFRLFAGVTGKEFYAWFKKIVSQLAAKLRRRERGRRRDGAPAVSIERGAPSERLAEVLEDDLPSPEAVAVLRESAAVVRRAVKELPADERRLVQLVVEGISLAEVERTFGGDPRSCWRRAKRHLGHALRNLREPRPVRNARHADMTFTARLQSCS